MADVTCFRVGHCRHPSCIAMAGTGLRPRIFHAHAYLITASRGRWLFDTGYADHFHSASARGIYRLYPWVTPAEWGAPLHAQLRQRGIHPDQIDGIAISHFHGDHIAGLHDFPLARLVCSGAAWRAVRGLSGWAAVRRGVLPLLLPDDVEQRLTLAETARFVALPDVLRPFRSGWDVSGSGEIVMVDLPGHAAGQMGAFVRGERGWTLLAADAAWFSEGYRELRGPSLLSFLVQHDRRAYYATLRMLHELHAAGQVRIRLAHDDVPDPTAKWSDADGR
jgi:glyoxylase-like metal-dependent hydrolase (beta-lactamase superfamily II)